MMNRGWWLAVGGWWLVVGDVARSLTELIRDDSNRSAHHEDVELDRGGSHDVVYQRIWRYVAS